jgi:hypothetical protein
MACEVCTENDKEGRGWVVKAVVVKVAEVQNMARHVLRIARAGAVAVREALESAVQVGPTKATATKATGKQKCPTLRNVGIRYRRQPRTLSSPAGPCPTLRNVGN